MSFYTGIREDEGLVTKGSNTSSHCVRFIVNGTISAGNSQDGFYIAPRDSKILNVKTLCQIANNKFPIINVKKTSNPVADLPSGGTSVLTGTISTNASNTVFTGTVKSNGDENLSAGDVLHMDVTIGGSGGNPSGLTVIVEIQNTR